MAQNHLLSFKTQLKQKYVQNFRQHYEVFDKLGAGSFGSVYACMHI